MEALRASIALTEKEKGKLEEPKSTLTPRKRTSQRAKEA
jgi:hypothetical protein